MCVDYRVKTLIKQLLYNAFASRGLEFGWRTPDMKPLRTEMDVLQRGLLEDSIKTEYGEQTEEIMVLLASFSGTQEGLLTLKKQGFTKEKVRVLLNIPGTIEHILSLEPAKRKGATEYFYGLFLN